MRILPPFEEKIDPCHHHRGKNVAAGTVEGLPPESSQLVEHRFMQEAAMIDLAALLNVIADTAKEITNLMGLIEKNLASYDRLQERFRRKRLEARLEELLRQLSDLRGGNLPTLWRLARLIDKDDSVQLDYLGKSLAELEIDEWTFDYDFRQFLGILLKMRDLIDEFKSDIVSVDYRLYEALQDAVKNRIAIVGLLAKDGGRSFSPDRLKALFSAYSELVKSTEELKNKLQQSARAAGKQRMTRRKTRSQTSP